MTEIIDLPEKLDTSMAHGLGQRLAAAMEGGLLIDGQRVQSLGTLCAQTLLAAERKAMQDGKPFQLRASQAMQDDLRLLGLAELARAQTEFQSGDMT